MMDRLSTGIPGLDEILHGGLIARGTYLVRGPAGSGKTTLGAHFLAAGRDAGEKALLITLGEPEAHLRRNAAAIGLDLQGITLLDLSPSPEFFAEVQTYDIFSPAEVEREPTTRKIIQQVEALKPQRVFLDAMTQFRYLATDPFPFRKQVLSFLRFLVAQGATVLFTSEASRDAPDDDLQFISDGVIELGVTADRHTVGVTKFRGSDFRAGRHAVRLTGAGMRVFPRLVPEEHARAFQPELIPSGVPELDELLNGGLERGTVTLISGPTGAGKTTLGLQFMKEVAGRGERSTVYAFEEEIEILLRRCDAVNIPARKMQEQGTLNLVRVEPLRFTPDEFAFLVRREVEDQRSRVVMIDSTAGYRLSLRGEDLVPHLHALCKYLQAAGVAVFLTNEVEAITGDFRATEAGISYMADNIIFLRYLEIGGEMRKAIGVLKKRLSGFEKTLREFEITRYGIKVGRPLAGLRGLLSGTPTWVEREK